MSRPYDETRREDSKVLAALESGDMDMLYLALTPRQRAFCREYVVDRNGAAAAVRAGYSPKFADRQAHQLVKHRGVAAYLDYLTLSAEAKIVSIDPEYIIQKTLKVINKDDAKDADILRGLEMLGRHLKMFTDKTEITGKDGEAIEIKNQQIAQEANEFTERLKSLRDRAEKKDVTLV